MNDGSPLLRVGVCLSLTGPDSRFGRQAALGLRAWHSIARPPVELHIEDDGGDPGRMGDSIRRLALRCDLLLGPYSTRLVRAAGPVVAGLGLLLWNHGGAGDDVQAAWPGHLVSVLTPCSRYARPFLLRVAGQLPGCLVLTAPGRGSFGRQVAAGAEDLARQLGLETARIEPAGELPWMAPQRSWALLCAGTFDEDVGVVKRALKLTAPPWMLCAVAAGVREFGAAVAGAAGVYGIAQWFPGLASVPVLGPSESEFLAAYAAVGGGTPDYPAAQAAAGAVLATHCAQAAASSGVPALWSIVASLEAKTFFGSFKIDPATGAQSRHETVLVRWTEAGEPVAIPRVD